MSYRMEKRSVLFRACDHRIVRSVIEHLGTEKSNHLILIVQRECVDQYKDIKGLEILEVKNGRFCETDFPDYIELKKRGYLPVDEVYIPVKDIGEPYVNIERIIYRRMRKRNVNYIDNFLNIENRIIKNRGCLYEMTNLVGHKIVYLFQRLLVKYYLGRR